MLFSPVEPCNTRIGRTDGKGKDRCFLGFSGDTHTHPGCISVAVAVSDLLNGGDKVEKFKQGVQASMPELLVWQMGTSTALLRGMMRLYEVFMLLLI